MCVPFKFSSISGIQKNYNFSPPLRLGFCQFIWRIKCMNTALLRRERFENAASRSSLISFAVRPYRSGDRRLGRRRRRCHPHMYTHTASAHRITTTITTSQQQHHHRHRQRSTATQLKVKHIHAETLCVCVCCSRNVRWSVCMCA